MNFYDWVCDRAAAKGAFTDAHIARLVGVSQSTVHRWAGGGPREPEVIRRIAAGLDVPVIAVLVGAGYLTEKESHFREIEVTRELTNSELAIQVAVRLQALERPASPA